MITEWDTKNPHYWYKQTTSSTEFLELIAQLKLTEKVPNYIVGAELLRVENCQGIVPQIYCLVKNIPRLDNKKEVNYWAEFLFTGSLDAARFTETTNHHPFSVMHAISIDGTPTRKVIFDWDQ